MERMKRLYATTDEIEAEVLRALLRDGGIESTLDDDGGIDVRDEDAPAAVEILAAHFEKQDVGEVDPDAPPPLSPEESAVFEEGIQRKRFRARLWMASFYLLPAGVWVVVVAFTEDTRTALMAAGALGGLVAFVWIVNLLLEKQKGSAPR
jgi:hypothetical protein